MSRFVALGVIVCLAGLMAGDIAAPQPVEAATCNFYKCMTASGEFWCSWSGTTNCSWYYDKGSERWECYTTQCSGDYDCGELPCVE